MKPNKKRYRFGILAALLACAIQSKAAVTFDYLIGVAQDTLMSATNFSSGLPSGVTCLPGGQRFGINAGSGTGAGTRPSLYVWGNQAGYDSTLTFSSQVIVSSFQAKRNPWDDAALIVNGLRDGLVIWSWTNTASGWFTVTNGGGKPIDTLAFEGKWGEYDDFDVQATVGTMTFDDYIGQGDGSQCPAAAISSGLLNGITATPGGTRFGMNTSGPGGVGNKPSIFVWARQDGHDATLTFSSQVQVQSFQAKANPWDDAGQTVYGIRNNAVVWTWTNATYNSTFMTVTNGYGILIDTLAFEGRWYEYDDFNVQQSYSNDTDGDGMDDSWEIIHFGNLSRNGTGDFDSDGLNDLNEFTTGTNPTVTDSDSDGLSDGQEVNVRNTNPLASDTDGDGLTDGQEVNTYNTNPLVVDTDNDGINDGAEVAQGKNPLVAELISWFRFDDFNIVPRGNSAHLYFRCNPAATVSIDNGVGDVTGTMDGSGNGSVDVMTALSTLYTISSYTNGGPTNVATLKIWTLPVTNLACITFQDLPTSGQIPSTYWSQRLPGVDILWSGWTLHPKGDVSQLPPTAVGPFVTENSPNNASISFSTPVEVERFAMFSNNDPGAGNLSVTGLLASVVVWTWTPATDGFYQVTNGFGQSVDTVVFSGRWNHIDNILFGLPGTAATMSHPTIAMTTGTPAGQVTPISWSSKTNWFYNIQTAGTLGGGWTYQTLIPSGGTNTSSTMNTSGAQGFRRVVSFP